MSGKIAVETENGDGDECGGGGRVTVVMSGEG